MSGRPFKYATDEERIKAAKAQRRSCYEKNKEKYKPRANLRAKRTYWRNKMMREEDEELKNKCRDKIEELNRMMEEDLKK